ncbi:hypothetical protein Lal_00015586 [Lupinus albus]|nr:hypothetical protein Lal_00015586 [Lupinus albus]
MRKDHRVGGGVGGTSADTKNPTQRSPRTGQPLGYYASWPLFTLSHYYLVWWCAEQVYPSKRFTRSAILGDDICIADSKVAKVYRDALETLKANKLFASQFPCPDLTRGSIAMPPEEGGVEKVGEDIPSPEYGRSEKTPLHSSVTWDETTRLPESTTSRAEVHFSRLPFNFAPIRDTDPHTG